MSSRNQSLYRQLDELQPQLDKLLIESLQQEAAGKRSMFISRIMDNVNEGRFYQRPDVEQAEDIASQVIRLREKLGEPIHEGTTGVILGYAELKEKRIHLHGEERAYFAKVQLSKLGLLNTEAIPPEVKPASRSKTSDKISKPSKDRFFPVSHSEAIDLVKEMNFKHSEYSQRLPVSFINADADGDHGTKIAAFYTSDELLIFSFPETFPRVRAKALVVAALREFSCIDKDATYIWNRQKSISYRAYFSELNQLILTRRERAIKQAKYRSTDKFTSRCSPKSVKTVETFLKQIEIII